MRHDALPEGCLVIDDREAAEDTETSHRDAASELRVVRDMRASHQQRIAADNRRTQDALVDLNKLADARTIANRYALGAMLGVERAGIRSAMLRRRPNHRIRTNVDAITNRQRSRQDCRVGDLAAFADRGPSQQAIDFAADYDADLVYAKYWRPALEQLAAWDPAAA